MKELVIISGKGGTGKTSIAASFATLAQRKLLVDCDVDAADLHLILKPQVKENNEFWSGQSAFIDNEKCVQCGLCEKVCRFNAITNNYVVDPISCEGCGLCARVCPVDAITMKDNMPGHWFVSETRYGTLVHAKLGIAEDNSGKLVTLIRTRAKAIAQEQNLDYIISDGPPGTSCPVIASLSGADVALLVTEPTLSGIHDLERVASVCQHFGIPALVCINKYDINEQNTAKIEGYCNSNSVNIVAKIPFDTSMIQALEHEMPVVEFSNSTATQHIRTLWQNIVQALDDTRTEKQS
ncbi:MAG: ATP-binding protein [Dehalococcoidia bacterium]|nr:ATP-binding protein [Dehalococcoidia bacterium]